MRKIYLLPSLLALSLFLTGCSADKASTQNDTFANKEKCAVQAQSFLKSEKEKDQISGAAVLSEQYTYNQSLNTCLLYFEVVEQGAGTTYNIIDLLTNKNIFKHITYRDQSMHKYWNENCKESDGCYVKKESFDTKFNSLFSK
jgi:hypothetical protein